MEIYKYFYGVHKAKQTGPQTTLTNTVLSQCNPACVYYHTLSCETEQQQYKKKKKTKVEKTQCATVSLIITDNIDTQTKKFRVQMYPQMALLREQGLLDT